MNRYDDYFDFRMANKNDVDEIMSFMKEHWDPEHILANDKNFFEYHFGGLGDQIHVFLMCYKDGKMAGMYGYVPYSTAPGVTYFSGSIAKVLEGLPVPMCGLELMKRLYDQLRPFVEFTGGANVKTIVPLFEKVFHYRVGVLDQYYLLNRELRDFKIITVPQEMLKEPDNFVMEQWELVKLNSLCDIAFDFSKRYPRLPFKEKAFLEKRYFQHPIYQYDAYGVKTNCGYKGILFTRKVFYNGGILILIVDFLGDIYCLGGIGRALREILIEENAECVSFLESGMPTEILEQINFRKIDRKSTEVIVPTYFEPFVNCNIANHCISSDKDLILFKAMGDQDNPKRGVRHKGAIMQ